MIGTEIFPVRPSKTELKLKKLNEFKSLNDLVCLWKTHSDGKSNIKIQDFKNLKSKKEKYVLATCVITETQSETERIVEFDAFLLLCVAANGNNV